LLDADRVVVSFANYFQDLYDHVTAQTFQGNPNEPAMQDDLYTDRLTTLACQSAQNYAILFHVFHLHKIK
jgi:hypothetical protein